MNNILYEVIEERAKKTSLVNIFVSLIYFFNTLDNNSYQSCVCTPHLNVH